MPLTLDHTDWSQNFRVVKIPGSANPVFILASGPPNSQPELVLKFAPGAERIRFANTVFERMNMSTGRTRYIDRSSPEVEVIFAALERACPRGMENRNRIQVARDHREFGVLLMEFNPGQKFEDAIGMTEEALVFHNLIEMLEKPTIRQDMARLIAADMLLGNFDRIAFMRKDDFNWGKMHGGNFFYAQMEGVAHLLPLDNDTIAPSLQHIQVKNGPATQEDLYRAVIQGTVLNAPAEVFPEGTQSSLDWLLGPEAAESIAKIFAQFFRAAKKTPEARTVATYLPYAQQMVPYVRAALVEILSNRKDQHGPGGTISGLNTIMQAYKNIEGMNYDVFKVRCRFAEFMVDATGGAPVTQRDTDENVTRAVAYGKYRDWKKEYLRCLEPPENYPIPGTAPTANMGKMQKAGRKVTSFLRIGTGDRNVAHDVKNWVRGGRATEDDLRQEWEWVKDIPDSDRAVVKTKLLFISELVRFDLERRFRVLNDVYTMAIAGDWVATFYCKFMCKRARQLIQTKNMIAQQTSAIKSRLAASGERSHLVMELDTAYKMYCRIVEMIIAQANRT